MSAIEATVSSFKSMADGCLRIALDFRENESKAAKQLLCDVGATVAIARLSEAPGQTEMAAPKEPIIPQPQPLRGKPCADYGKVPAETPEQPKAPYGDAARILRLSSFFRTEAVWKAVGTDKEFREWIQKQPSCLDGNQDWVTELGEGRCEAAHVRRAGESGTGTKSDYSCVPLTHEQHQMQHTLGELDAIKRYRDAHAKHPDWANGWFNQRRIEYVQAWCWQKLKRDLNYGHWNDLPPSVLQAWAASKSVAHLLPSGYME